MYIPLTSTDEPIPSQVGGKAASLIRLVQGKFNVPAGIVLPASFFSVWITSIRDSEAWQAVLAAADVEMGNLDMDDRARLARACDDVKQFAAGLKFDHEQGRTLASVRDDLGEGLFAVRSSSPEEDLGGASFAGLYETVLNTSPNKLDEAVRTCFSSCLDSRVLLYKLEMNFEDLSPSIAVVLQHQVASETSGVAFSLNPLTNDFDEALINASWGLGEALVSGDVTPDAIVVNKVSGEVIDNRLGTKGGERPDEACLDADQLASLTSLVSRVEAYYGHPVDVEWAFADGELYVLQARPITTFVPLPAELQTEPGAKRILYMDGALTDGLTMSGAISPMTLDAFEVIIRGMFSYMGGTSLEEIDLHTLGYSLRGSRIYVNISNYLHLLKGDKLVQQMESTNALMAEIFRSVDLDVYRMAKPPSHLRILTMLRHAPGILWRLRSVFMAALRPGLGHERFQTEYDDALREFDEWAARPIDYDQPLTELVLEDFRQVAITTMASTAPALIYFVYFGTLRLRGLAKSPEQLELVDAICRGYPDDMVVQMGLAMFDLSTMLAASEFNDLQALVQKIEARDLPQEFLSAWDDFIERYGCRGPLEMELANPKYAENPKLALRQIGMIANSGGNFNPHDVQRELVQQRESAFDALLAQVPRRKQRVVKRSYQNILRYYSGRELIKHHMMQVNERIRTRLLHAADQLVAAGRLIHRDRVFDLSLAEVDQALQDEDFDVMAAAEVRGVPYRQVTAQVRHFPMAIDSRGRILRPKKQSEDGAMVGAPISPGVVQGPVKVLNDPFEKDVEFGDILVAVTTDPGWTPLFINAAAVVLEIGGELQHGALVAREYGKPCVAGIADITTLLKDGQLVEVDGSAGTVRIIEE